MSIKKIPNYVTLREHEGVVSFFSSSKKGHFQSESKLFEAVEGAVSQVSPYFSVHLSTYPYIAVHVSFGKADELYAKKEALREKVQQAIESHIKFI